MCLLPLVDEAEDNAGDSYQGFAYTKQLGNGGLSLSHTQSYEQERGPISRSYPISKSYLSTVSYRKTVRREKEYFKYLSYRKTVLRERKIVRILSLNHT